MPLQNFVDYSAPAIHASWLNQVDAFVNTLFGGASNAGAARTAISAAASGANTDITSITGTAAAITGGLANQITFQASPGVNGFIPAPSTGSTYLEWTGSAFAWASVAGAGTVTSVAATVPAFLSVSGSPITSSGTLAISYSGTALPIANGGSGQTTAQLAMNAFAGAVTSAQFLRGNGTNVVMAAISAGDVPTLNQNTTGSAGSLLAGATIAASPTVPAIYLTNAAEVTNVIAAAPTSTQNLYLNLGATTLFTTNAANNWTFNVAMSSGTSLNTALATGQTVTLAASTTQGGTAYYCTALTIDGSAQTVKWIGGAPSAGNASGLDVYLFTITKTASATYTVLGSQTQYK